VWEKEAWDAYESEGYAAWHAEYFGKGVTTLAKRGVIIYGE
jgi:hypothetical protein